MTTVHTITNLIFNEIYNDFIEIHGGWKNWFRPLMNFERNIDSIAISVTSNANGFTPLTAVARYFSLDLDLIRANAERCQESLMPHLLKTNANGKIDCCPVNLIFTPKLKTIELCDFIFDDIISICKSNNISLLHLTHFCFMQTDRGINQLNTIIQYLLKPKTKVGGIEFVFDLDSRYYYDFLSKNQYEIFRDTNAKILTTLRGDLFNSQSLDAYLKNVREQMHKKLEATHPKEHLLHRLHDAQMMKLSYLDRIEMIDNMIASLNSKIDLIDT